MSFDINSVDLEASAETGAWMQVEHPVTGMAIEGTRIHLRGTDAPVFSKKVAQINEKFQGKKVSQEAATDKACELLAALTIGWEGFDEDGKALKFSFDAAKALYKKHKWLREQVDRFVADRGNFLATA